MTEVNETTWVNQYTYDPTNLLIAYRQVECCPYIKSWICHLENRRNNNPSTTNSYPLIFRLSPSTINQKANSHLSCSILACVVTVLIGAYAIYANGESHDTYFSSTSNAMQNPDIAALFRLHSTDAEPLEKTILSKRIRLVRNGEVERFCLDGEDSPEDFVKRRGERDEESVRRDDEGLPQDALRSS